MGRSEPTFIVEACNPFFYDTNNILANINFYDDASIRAAAKIYKKRTLACWAYEGFKLNATAENGPQKIYHFLEYSGTRQLAEDIERVREIFGNQKISIYGVSYGTRVMGTYATIFPDNVNLMVLDGSDNSNSDIVQRSEDEAMGSNQRINYFIAACEFTQTCLVEDTHACINDVNELVRNNIDDMNSILGDSVSPHMIMKILLTFFSSRYDLMNDICMAAEDGDYERFREIVKDAFDSPLKLLSRQDIYPQDSPSKPTSGQSDEWPFENYYSSTSSIPQDMVTAQDYTFGSYSEDDYVKFLQDLNEEYPGAGTGVSVSF